MAAGPQHPTTLPSPWNVYNLRGSPFFQNTLEASEYSQAPLSLFVGRAAELSALRNRIHAASQHGSRQAIAGAPGVGKTTLVQELKAMLVGTGFLATDSWVPILPEDTSESLFGRVLGSVFDTVLANRPGTIEHPAMRDAQVLIRALRTRFKGLSLSIAPLGGGITQGESARAPADLMLDGPRVLRDLMYLVRNSDGQGVVVHLNNLENLSERDASNAAELVRGLRDPMLMHERLHVILVGTTDAVNTVVNTHAQVRNVFTVQPLGALDVPVVHAMLHARYQHFRQDAQRDYVAPVRDEAVEAIYALYRGDLRGMLKALDDGATPLIGLITEGAEGKARPIAAGDLASVLQERCGTHLDSLAEQTRVEQVRTWGERDPFEAHTQQSLQDLWGISQGAVSGALKYLIQQGFVTALPREGREPIRYVLSGTSLLVFGGLRGRA
jgi:predicted ATPase